MVLCGGGVGGGGGGGRMFVVVVVVVVMVGGVYCQTGTPGFFQLYKSCEAHVRLANLIVNNPMWLRGTREAVSITTAGNTSYSCHLPPDQTHHVSKGHRVHIQIEVAGAAGEEGRVCNFPRDAVLVLPRGLLKVSCLADKRQAEEEMLADQESPGSGASSVGPQHRALDVAPTNNTTHDAPTTTLGRPYDATTTPPPPQDGPSTPQPPHHALTTPHTTTTTPEPPHFHEPPTPSTTLKPPVQSTSGAPLTPTPAGEGLTLPPGTPTGTVHLKTILMVTGRASPIKTPPVTHGRTMETTGGDTTEVPDYMSEHMTTDGTPPPPPDTNTTQHTGLTGTHESGVNKANVLSLGPAMISNASQKDDYTSSQPDDQVIYLAGVGAAVMALVVGVIAVASVAIHRRRQAKAKERKSARDLFMSGRNRGSVNSLTHSDSQGAYLNAHLMYSGAEPEFAESFEMEERIVNSNISYSSHDTPKCLRDH